MATLPITRFIVLALALLRPAFAADEQWSREFFPGATSHSVINAMLTTPDGKLIYAGRSLPTEFGSAVIAMQTGDVRMPLATYGADVYALAHDGQYLYAGGDFATLSGFAVTNLARWDGRKWTQLGGGISGGPVRT